MIEFIRRHEPRPWPSARLIARETGYTVRTVRRTIAKMKTASWEVEERWRANGSQASNAYRLPQPSLEESKRASYRKAAANARKNVTPRKATPGRKHTRKSVFNGWRETYNPRYARVAQPRRRKFDMSAMEPRNGVSLTAQDVIGALIDEMKGHGVPISGRAKGIIAKQAKELLADGFKPETVLAAAVIALRRVEPHNCHFIAQDIALVEAGQHLDRREYRMELANAKQRLDPASAQMQDQIRQAMRDQ